MLSRPGNKHWLQTVCSVLLEQQVKSQLLRDLQAWVFRSSGYLTSLEPTEGYDITFQNRTLSILTSWSQHKPAKSSLISSFTKIVREMGKLFYSKASEVLHSFLVL